ncbi:hypothetical protein ACFZDK_34260 [Streptomyces sp. NPDC007901]|uniref:hypothetical protein n=1 Tax=Streptomyces sp. NPDC007901 TaxID=3364785 RepID=UPI0036F107E7
MHALVDQGRPQRAIARELGLSRNTVRRFARAATWQELVTGKWQCLPSILDDLKPYLHQRWNEGCTTAATLFEEITAAAYRGVIDLLAWTRALLLDSELAAAEPKKLRYLSQPRDFLPQALHPHAGSRLSLLQHSQHRRHRAPLDQKRTQDVARSPSTRAKPCLPSRNQGITFGWDTASEARRIPQGSPGLSGARRRWRGVRVGVGLLRTAAAAGG